MQSKWNMNPGWYFKPDFNENDIAGENLADYECIDLPHTVKELPYNCFSHDETALCCTYVKKFTVPQECEGKNAVIEFEGVMTQHKLYVNGALAGEHRGGYSRWRCDITQWMAKGENTLVVMVDSREDKDIPPFGYTIDYLTYGGIYRDVNLYFLPQAWLDTVLFRYRLTGGDAEMAPEVHLENKADAFEGVLHLELLEDGRCVKRWERSVTVEEGGSTATLAGESFSKPTLWDLEDPHLYTVRVTLYKDGAALDRHTLRIGFRTVECKPEGFYLNGRAVKLVGLDRHQSYPYSGYAMPARAQKKDAEILRNYLHVNTVRTSHYMQSEDFLDRCDELGLLVFSEMPGWGYIGGEAFKENALQNIRDMITVEYNHPSIFIWSIRINESDDDDAFYTQTNELAKSLDTSRATTGVRCITNSHLIEDVYTFNDFIHYSHPVKHYREVVLLNQQKVTGLTHKVPYLVSEYCGHVFPVKPFDCEEKQMRHVQIHAAVQSANMLRKDAMGAIGWCAFDYNTHGDYGSGDKICYHGVMDMFRIPKYAAQVYRSQVSPQKEIVLEPATVFARGENDDNRPIPFAVLTNCDYIEVEAYGRSIGKFFPSLSYCGLAHPPIIVDEDPGRWQDIWEGGAIIGYLNGKEAARRTYSRDAHLAGLAVTPDDLVLNNTVVDSTRFACRFLDQNQNLLPFYNGVVQVEVSEGLKVIGPKTIAVVGGSIGFWVKTTPINKKMEATVTVRALNTSIPDQVFCLRLEPQKDILVL
ncbi:glycoside hydrolase family 2 protein [Harryflintia acetispora]|uniref:Beta-galactosidase n=1 Tax=Harryflintia acetispora TaxID=1849041 RepID=A0A9X8Y8A7_9FIRM|nr:glycoside hydrolase family 2 TIM barrel-domain containing protein [Harryflintia acetispora]TCL43264.1 beta-galactosidase [Harryflintia acetispora]